MEGSESKDVEKENLGNYFKEVEIFKTVINSKLITLNYLVETP